MRQYKTFKRYFNNYDGFGSFKGIMFLDSVAAMVQEFLYSTKKEAQIYFQLDGLISLYDFMSLEVYVINPMLHELGLSAIKDFINSIRQQRPGYDFCEVEYMQDRATMAVYKATDRLIIPLLWTAYIYANARYIVEKDKTYNKAAKMCYQLLLENSYYSEEKIKEAYPIKYSKEATQMLINHIGKKCKELLKQDKETKEKLQGGNEEKEAPSDRIKSQESNYKEEMESMIMELLVDICEKNKDYAQLFLEEVRGASDMEIPLIVKRFKNERKIAKNRSSHSIWIVLHAAKLYGSSESNFNIALRKHS